MSLNKVLFPFLFALSTLVVLHCGDSQKEKDKAALKDYKDPIIQLNEAKTVLGNNTKLTYLGTFTDETHENLAAGLEISTKDKWGIKFALLNVSGNKPKKIFETGLLEGSFSNSLVEKIKLPSLDCELLYYNSRDYFLGSGGGEVFSYLINFKDKKVYFAHLVADFKKVSLYLSNNIDIKDVENFFLNTFKKDFPSYVLVSQDVVLDD